MEKKSESDSPTSRSGNNRSSKPLSLEKIMSSPPRPPSSEIQAGASHQDSPSTAYTDERNISQSPAKLLRIDLKPVKIPLWTKAFDEMSKSCFGSFLHRPERVNQIVEKINTSVAELQTTLASDHFSADEKTVVHEYIDSLVKNAQASYEKALHRYGKDMGMNSKSRNKHEDNLINIYKKVEFINKDKRSKIISQEKNLIDLQKDEEIEKKVMLAEKGIYDPKIHEEFVNLYSATTRGDIAASSYQPSPELSPQWANLDLPKASWLIRNLTLRGGRVDVMRQEVKKSIREFTEVVKQVPHDQQSQYLEIFSEHISNIKQLYIKASDYTQKRSVRIDSEKRLISEGLRLHSIVNKIKTNKMLEKHHIDLYNPVETIDATREIGHQLNQNMGGANEIKSLQAESSTSCSMDMPQGADAEHTSIQYNLKEIIAHADKRLELARASLQSFDKCYQYISAEDMPLIDNLTKKAIAAAGEAHQQLIAGPQEGIDLSLAQKGLDEASNWLQDTPVKIRKAYEQQIARMTQNFQEQQQKFATFMQLHGEGIPDDLLASYQKVFTDFEAHQQKASRFKPAEWRQQLDGYLTDVYRQDIQRQIRSRIDANVIDNKSQVARADNARKESSLALRAHKLAMAKERLTFLDEAAFLSTEESNMLSDYKKNRENLSTDLSAVRQLASSQRGDSFKSLIAKWDSNFEVVQENFERSLKQQGWLSEVASTSKPVVARENKIRFSRDEDEVREFKVSTDEELVDHAASSLNKPNDVVRSEHESDQSYQNRQEISEQFHITLHQIDEKLALNYPDPKKMDDTVFLPHAVENKISEQVSSLYTAFDAVCKQTGAQDTITLKDSLTQLQKIKEDLDVWQQIHQIKIDFNSNIDYTIGRIGDMDLSDEIEIKCFKNLDNLKKLHDDHHTSLENHYENTLSFNQADKAAIEHITDQAQAMYDNIDEANHQWQAITSAYKHSNDTIQNLANKLNELTEDKLPPLFHEIFHETVKDISACFHSLLENYTKDFSVKPEDKACFDDLHRDIQDLSKELDKELDKHCIQDATEKLSIAVQQYVPKKYQDLVHKLTEISSDACKQVLENDQPDAREQFEKHFLWLKQRPDELKRVSEEQSYQEEGSKQGQIGIKLEKNLADNEILLACLGSEKVSIYDKNIDHIKNIYINDMDTLMGRIVKLQDEGKIAKANKCAEQFISTKQAFEHYLKKQGLLSGDYENMSKIEEIKTQLHTLASEKLFQRKMTIEVEPDDSSKLPRPERLKKNLEQFDTHFKELSTTLEKSNLPVELETKVVEVTSSLAHDLHKYSTYIMHSYKYDLLRPEKKSRDKAEAKLRDLTTRMQEVKSDFHRLHNAQKHLDTADQYHASQETQQVANEKFDQAIETFTQVLHQHHDRSSHYQHLRLQFVISSREVQETLQLPSKASAVKVSIENIANYIDTNKLSEKQFSTAPVSVDEYYAKSDSLQVITLRQKKFAALRNKYFSYLRQVERECINEKVDIDIIQSNYKDINKNYEKVKKYLKEEVIHKKHFRVIEHYLKIREQELLGSQKSIQKYLKKLEEEPIDKIAVIDNYLERFQKMERHSYKKLLKSSN